MQLLDVSAAGLLVADPRGQLRVVAASSQAARLLELFQLQPDRGGELVLPARDCLAGPVAAARVRMDMLAAGRALGVRPGIRRGVDREPLPPPPCARLRHLRRRLRGQAGQGAIEQAGLSFEGMNWSDDKITRSLADAF